MGRKGKSSKTKSKQQSGIEEGLIFVDPARVRFQHSKIRPYFSGCGRSVMETLESLRKKEISPSDLPPIQVIVGPETEDGPSYFSLNNRRLWVLKRCREEGLLENNLVQVRVRKTKSGAELARYSIENCALEAKIMKEGRKQKEKIANVKDKNDNGTPSPSKAHASISGNLRDEKAQFSDSEGSSSSRLAGSNPFSSLA